MQVFKASWGNYQTT